MEITASLATSVPITYRRTVVFETPGLYQGVDNNYIYWCVNPRLVIACLNGATRQIDKSSIWNSVHDLPEQDYIKYPKAINLTISN